MIDPLRQVVLMFFLGLVGGYFYGTSSVEKRLRGEGGGLKTADNRNCKMVFVIRTDIPIAKGKLAELCAQACLACYETSVNKALPQLRAWKKQGQAKITLKCNSQDELHILQRKADFLGLVSRTIVDPKNGPAVLGIGPAPKSFVDQVTGELSLF